MMYHLTDAQLAGYFAAERGAGTYQSAELVDAVEAWLQKNGLSHRSAAAVARDVDKLAREARPAPKPALAPEAFAFSDDVMQGVGDRRPPSAEELRAMSIEDYIGQRDHLHAQVGIRRPQNAGIFGALR